MANPRQRRKSRSSSHKPVSHSRHAKRNLKKTPPIRAPKVLQLAWDKQKTVKQNYASLGLIHSLNPSAPGGSEKPHQPSFHDAPPQPSLQPHLASTPAAPKGFGRIIRNEVGNITRVEVFEGSDCQGVAQTEMALTMENMEPEVDKSIIERWTTGLGGNPDIGEKATGLLKELEKIAAVKHVESTTLAVPQSRSGANTRHSSTGEIAYLQHLIEKYGEDVERMAKDRKLNTDQRTEGQLRRALRIAGLQSGNCG